MNGDKVAELMATEGPIVEVVMVRQNGTIEQLTMDMTPKANKIAEALCGPATIVGQYRNDVVVLRNREPNMETTKENIFVLPRPFQDEKAHGDFLMVRMDEESVPQDFTKDELVAYIATVASEPIPTEAELKAEHDAAIAAAEEEAEEEVSDAEDEDEEEEVDDESAWEQIQIQIRESLKEEHGRDATDEEFKEALESIQKAMAAAGEEADGDDDDDDDEEFVLDDIAEEEEQQQEEEEATDEQKEAGEEKVEVEDKTDEAVVDKSDKAVVEEQADKIEVEKFVDDNVVDAEDKVVDVAVQEVEAEVKAVVEDKAVGVEVKAMDTEVIAVEAAVEEKSENEMAVVEDKTVVVEDDKAVVEHKTVVDMIVVEENTTEAKTTEAVACGEESNRPNEEDSKKRALDEVTKGDKKNKATETKNGDEMETPEETPEAPVDENAVSDSANKIVSEDTMMAEKPALAVAEEDSAAVQASKKQRTA